MVAAAAWDCYDLTINPQEVINRYHDPKYQTIIAGEKQELIVQRKKYNETDEKYPNTQKVNDGHWKD